MTKNSAIRFSLPCLAILAASCGSPQADPAAQAQPEVSAVDQQADSAHASAMTREFVATCIKTGGDQEKIAAALTKVSGAPKTDPKLGTIWEHKIADKNVQVITADGTYKNKPTKDCSFSSTNAKVDSVLTEITKQTQAKRFGSSIAGGKHERIFTLDDAGNSFMVIAAQETKAGQPTTSLTSRLVKKAP